MADLQSRIAFFGGGGNGSLSPAGANANANASNQPRTTHALPTHQDHSSARGSNEALSTRDRIARYGAASSGAGPSPMQEDTHHPSPARRSVGARPAPYGTRRPSQSGRRMSIGNGNNQQSSMSMDVDTPVAQMDRVVAIDGGHDTYVRPATAAGYTPLQQKQQQSASTPQQNAARRSNEELSAKISAQATSNKCQSCNKTVYVVEQVVIDTHVFHKGCLKCTHCKSTLKMGNLASLDGKYYCKPHFKQLFKLKGNYSEGFGKEEPKRAWLHDHAPLSPK
ncbi:hypothetical protein BC831DRAFT_516761 [Entophlyctis helioformis]|nr:hypothetical protein BC831DRAFT_516761 [Entophlyctis helioformis]